MYNKPNISKIGGCHTVTTGTVKAREKDLFGFRALIAIHLPW